MQVGATTDEPAGEPRLDSKACSAATSHAAERRWSRHQQLLLTHQHQLVHAGREELLAVGGLAGHDLLLELPVDLLVDQYEAAHEW